MAALAGCADVNKDVISGTGTIKLINLEGEFYGIIGDDGKNYEPINLSDEFKKDGLRVRFQVKLTEDIASTHLWGTPVKIIKIEPCPT